MDINFLLALWLLPRLIMKDAFTLLLLYSSRTHYFTGQSMSIVGDEDKGRTRDKSLINYKSINKWYLFSKYYTQNLNPLPYAVMRHGEQTVLHTLVKAAIGAALVLLELYA